MNKRIKYRRNLRRVSQVLSHVLETGEFREPEKTHPLIRWWIDPRGDSMVRETLHLFEMAHLQIEGFPQQMILLRTAVACFLYEREHGQLPETLEDLVPEFFSQLPQSRWQVTLHHKSREVSSDTPPFRSSLGPIAIPAPPENQ